MPMKAAPYPPFPFLFSILLAALSVTSFVSISNATTPLQVAEQAYLTAFNPQAYAWFGFSVAVSGDTIVVGAPQVEGQCGGAYIFVRTGTNWTQQAHLKGSNTEPGDYFGWSVAIAGNTVVVGANREASNATGIDGDSSNNSAANSGAAYIFVRSGTTWSQQAYLKASNTGADDGFGWSVAVSGETVVIGAPRESSNATGVNGDQNDDSAAESGAAYVFVRNGTTWSQQAYLKASNTDAYDIFALRVGISGDTVVVGAPQESSKAAGVNGDQSENNAGQSGAAYIFVRNEATWSQQAYLKASNTGAGDFFGSVTISGNTVVVGADAESSSATGINGDENDDSTFAAGAAYVFVRTGATWSQQAYLKSSNTMPYGIFGFSAALSGNMLVVTAPQEDNNTGLAYVFVRNGTTWRQQGYLDRSNSEAGDVFGLSIALSADTVVAGAPGKNSYTAPGAGATYVFSVVGLPPDSDGDGVPDAEDICPNTPPGVTTDLNGCSIEQLVPCEGPWRNHGEYVRALQNVTSRFVMEGLLNKDAAHEVLKRAATRDCGKK
jgi:hypothetical protein